MWHQVRTDKGNKKMKGLAITILLAFLQIGAMATSAGDLLSGGPETVRAAAAADII